MNYFENALFIDSDYEDLIFFPSDRQPFLSFKVWLNFSRNLSLSFACTKESNQRKVQPIQKLLSLIRRLYCELALV